MFKWIRQLFCRHEWRDNKRVVGFAQRGIDKNEFVTYCDVLVTHVVQYCRKCNKEAFKSIR